MGGSRDLRDARHTDKFLWTLCGERFYEPFESGYQPNGEYTDILDELLERAGDGWRRTRDGIWFHIHPRQLDLSLQGWKVHVSATSFNGASILRKVAPVALASGVPFKFALDGNVLSVISSKLWSRGGSGKFITLYPRTTADFKALLEELYTELLHEEGPYILSDKRYRDCRVLYYRFGGIRRNSKMDVIGREVPVLISPDGEALPDVRTPYFSLPDWVADPFPCEEPEQNEISLDAGRYQVQRALGFSNSGGVYEAVDRSSGAVVVIKEGRAYAAMDQRGIDAIKRLKREHEILELLRGTGVTPAPVALFQEWENLFLVEEYVSGVDIRSVLLTQNPLLRVRPSLPQTADYYEAFRRILHSLVQAVGKVHERGVAVGDLSANNLRVDPTTREVRLIDLEGAFRPGVDEPTNLYTPGFRNPSRIHTPAPGLVDDLYGLAAIALYMLFPIPSLSSLRSDLYDGPLDMLLRDMGWAGTRVADVVRGLKGATISCTEACELLDQPVGVVAPSYSDAIDTSWYEKTAREMGRFLLSNLRPDGPAGLFPADPFMYQTNPLSLGFGACGVLYALHKSGFEIPSSAFDRLKRELDNVGSGRAIPPGFLTGAAGIAWCVQELGMADRAAQLMSLANQSPLLRHDHSYFYGMAGVGMANLHMHVRTGQPEYLAAATSLADTLLETAAESAAGIYWEGGRAGHGVHLGYGYGQSGVALFLLRLSQVTGADRYRTHGQRALEFDLAHTLEVEDGVSTIPLAPGGTTLEPYIEVGSAGVAKVAMRYGISERMDSMLSDAHRKYSGFAGLIFGLGSFVDVLTDAFLFSGDARYLEMARRPATGLRDLYVLPHPDGVATPGDGLLRISCDYATGVAGVMRALQRLARPDTADFLLDEISPPLASPMRNELHPSHAVLV